jgi:DNA-binding NarL/FixJ family response regulator
VSKIVELRKAGKSVRAIARQVKVSTGVVHKTVQNIALEVKKENRQGFLPVLLKCGL